MTRKRRGGSALRRKEWPSPRRLKGLVLAIPLAMLMVGGVTGTASASRSGVHRLVDRVAPGGELDGLFALLDPTLGRIDPFLQLLDVPGLTPAQGTCAGQEPTITGTEGDDVIEGTNGPDVIHGGSGDDTIDGNGGGDIICGGAGNDFIEGTGQRDVIQGGSGDDTIDGNGGIDFIYGGKGNDFIRWTSSEFTYSERESWIYGGDGNDTIGVPLDRDKTGGEDHLYGGEGSDHLYGGHGDDDLHGGVGDDHLRGEAGIDLTDGGSGVDTCDNDASGDVGVSCEV